MGECNEVQGLIAAALYGALPAADQARLQSHLAGCDACRREHEELTETARIVGQPEPADIQGDAFVSAVRRKLGAKTHRRLPLKKPVARRQAWALPLTAAAALLMAAVGIYFLTRPKPALETEVAVHPPTPVVVPAPAPRTPEPPPPPVVAPAPAPQPAPTPKPENPPPPPPPPTPVTPEPEPAQAPVVPSRETVAVMATLETVAGDAVVLTEGAKVAAKAEFGLIPGQEVRTGSRSSYVVIKITDGTRIHLAGDTTLRLVNDLKGAAGRTFLLSRGSLRADVAKQPPTAPMVFATPTADARVLGTELVLFAGAESTRLDVRTGKVRLTRREDGASVEVGAGQTATAPKTGAFAPKAGRASQGLQALYLFHEGQGNVVHDVAASGAPLDLRILKGRTPWAGPGLLLDGNPVVKSDVPATRIIDACRKTQEITLEAWVHPLRGALDFEGAIVSLSTDVQDRNFALSQNTSAFDAALRTSTTDGGGRPPLSTAKGTCSALLTHIVFTRDAKGSERLYVNGLERTMRSRAGNFGTWNDAFHLYLGNESHEERPWSGTLRLAAVYSQALPAADVVRNFKAGVE